MYVYMYTHTVHLESYILKYKMNRMCVHIYTVIKYKVNSIINACGGTNYDPLHQHFKDFPPNHCPLGLSPKGHATIFVLKCTEKWR